MIGKQAMEKRYTAKKYMQTWTSPSMLFLYNGIEANNHSNTNLDQSQSFTVETSIKAPRYLGLGRVLEFEHRKVDNATTMKYRKMSSSDKVLPTNLLA